MGHIDATVQPLTRLAAEPDVGQADNFSETAFAVDGMFCGGCASTVERALKRLPGVYNVSVSFLNNCAFVTHDPLQVSAGALAKRLATLGYEARPLDESKSDCAQSDYQRAHQIRLGIAIGFGLWVMMASMARYLTELPTERSQWWVALAAGILSLPVLFYSGVPFFRLGWRGLLARAPGMETLILVATVAAVSGSIIELWQGGSHVWFEVPVMLIIFQLMARLTDFGARRRAADAVRSMLDLSPETVRRIDATGLKTVTAKELCVDDVIESRAGERIAGDGIIILGDALLDTSLLTGESLPESVGVGSDVLAGMLNTNGTIHIRVTASGEQRTLDQLAATVGRALSRKSDLMRLADRVAGWLVPTISAAALIAFLLALLQGDSSSEALARALAVLVVSCPCALSLSVPLVISVTAATAARNGIVLRDPASIEHAAGVDTVMIDKTGTLTEGKLTVSQIVGSPGYDEYAVLRLAAWAVAGSNHPLARAITRHADHVLDDLAVEDRSCPRYERAGSGVRTTCADGSVVIAGSQSWLLEHEVSDIPLAHDATRSRVLIARNACFVGAVELTETVRSDAVELLTSIRAGGMTPILVSGDTPGCVAEVANRLDLPWHAEVTPEGKRDLVEQYREQGFRVAFVGDGLNDALALAAAEVGIATRDASDLARSAASISILTGGLNRVEGTLSLLRRAAKVLYQNLIWAVVYNAILLPAAVLGFVHPVLAAIAMMLSASSVSINSLRIAAHKQSGFSAAKAPTGAE